MKFADIVYRCIHDKMAVAAAAPDKMSGEHPYSREAQDGYSEPRDCRASHTHTHTISRR